MQRLTKMQYVLMLQLTQLLGRLRLTGFMAYEVLAALNTPAHKHIGLI